MQYIAVPFLIYKNLRLTCERTQKPSVRRLTINMSHGDSGVSNTGVDEEFEKTAEEWAKVCFIYEVRSTFALWRTFATELRPSRHISRREIKFLSGGQIYKLTTCCERKISTNENERKQSARTVVLEGKLPQTKEAGNAWNFKSIMCEQLVSSTFHSQ